MLSTSYQDDNEDYIDRSFEYDRRSRLPQTPLVELDSFDPIIGLEFNDLDLIRKEIAKWLVDLAAPPKPILSVLIGDSLTARPKGDSLTARPKGDSLTARPKGDSLTARPKGDSLTNESDLLSAVIDSNFLKSLSISSTTGKPITGYLKFWPTSNSHLTYEYPGVLTIASQPSHRVILWLTGV
jgi:hypothetical protein